MRNFTKGNVSTEAFSDGSTISGAIVGIKAKLIEAFEKDHKELLEKSLNKKDILNAISEARDYVNSASGDNTANDVSYVPLKGGNRLLSIHEAVIKNPRAINSQLDRGIKLGIDICTKLLPGYYKDADTLIDIIILSAKDPSKGRLQLDAFRDRKNDYGLGKYLTKRVNSRRESDDFLGCWKIASESGNATPIIVFMDSSELRTDPISTHMKPWSRKDTLELLMKLEDKVELVSKYVTLEKGGSDSKVMNDLVTKASDLNNALLNHLKIEAIGDKKLVEDIYNDGQALLVAMFGCTMPLLDYAKTIIFLSRLATLSARRWH